MGNTDTLHPNSCFCSFSIPTSEIFTSFYAHAHETTPTSGYKLSLTHIVVEERPEVLAVFSWSVPFLPSPEVLNSC